MSNFAEQIEAFHIKAMTKVNNAISETIQGVTLSLIDKSPYGHPELWASKPPKGYEPGQFRANWQGGVNQINDLTTDDVDVTGEISVASVYAAIPAQLVGTVFYITNSLPYAQRLEDGWAIHNIPPGNFVGLTVLEFQNIIITSVAKVKSQ
jgi:hypothetical protein